MNNIYEYTWTELKQNFNKIQTNLKNIINSTQIMVPAKTNNELYKKYAENTLQQFQLNLYKKTKTLKDNYNVFYCYINNKIAYVELAFEKESKEITTLCNWLTQHNIVFHTLNTSIFIDHSFFHFIKKTFNINNDNINIRFINSKFKILTNVFYKKMNNAVTITFQYNNETEQLTIYRWNNFDETVNKLYNLLHKFHFDINIILNYALINHYYNA